MGIQKAHLGLLYVHLDTYYKILEHGFETQCNVVGQTSLEVLWKHNNVFVQIKRGHASTGCFVVRLLRETDKLSYISE